MQPLPIDPLLPGVVAALRGGPSLVVEAPPGAGKTTRVPRALLEAGLAGGGEVVVLEPRRLAARLAARRVALELGERAGETVGYQVRFEEVAGPRTRIRYVTEGLLTRRLLSDPRLAGVGAVVLDEFHERHLPGDLALAFLRRLQSTARPDLKLVVMSATLDAEPVARFLSAPRLRSEGRRFEVAIEHLSPEEAARDERLEDRVARAVRRLHREAGAGSPGDVLVFLPGAAEIRRAREALAAGERSSLAELPAVTAADVSRAAAAGDPLASRVWAETVELIASAVANVLDVFNPELVVLGGGVTRAGEQLLGPVREAALAMAMGPAAGVADVVLAGLGDELDVVSAAAVALDRLGPEVAHA